MHNFKYDSPKATAIKIFIKPKKKEQKKKKKKKKIDDTESFTCFSGQISKLKRSRFPCLDKCNCASVLNDLFKRYFAVAFMWNTDIEIKYGINSNLLKLHKNYLKDR